MEQYIFKLSKQINSLLIKIFALLHISITNEQQQSLVQFIRFGLVGLSNTIIGYLLYLFFLLIMQHFAFSNSIDYMISNVLSWIISVFWSFIWNRKCVFNVKSGDEVPFFTSLIKAYCSYALTGLFLNNLLLYLEVQKLGISKTIAPFFVLIISIPVNFLLNKFWTFQRKTKDKSYE